MTTNAAVAVTILMLAGMNVWVHAAPRGTHLVTGPLAAVVLLLVARSSGLSWAELGLGRAALGTGAWYAAAAAALVAVAYGVAVAVPAIRTVLRDTRYRVGVGSALRIALLTIPITTVVFEEVAFRGVLWGLVAHDHGAVWATGVSSVLFGLWHVLPALDLARTNTVLRADTGNGRHRVRLTVLGTVAFTTVAGIVFAELRRASGSLLAPAGLHWAVNGLGVLASARAWAMSRT